jgi:hypothetical protein
MIDLLRELEDELARSAAPVAAALRPALAGDRLDALLEGLPQPIPDDVRALYSWHDGAEKVYGAYRAEVYRGGMFLPLDEAVANRSGGMANGYGWDERWLPVFMDEHFIFEAVVCGAGDGAVVTFAYLDLPSVHADYASLPDLVQSVIRRWRGGIYWLTDSGDVAIDPRALAVQRREEDGDEVDVAGLVRTLRDGTEAAWTDALWRLRTRLYPTAVPALIDMIQDPTAGRVRTYAAELLGVIGGTASTDALRRAADSDQDELVRGMAAAALRDMETIDRSQGISR